MSRARYRLARWLVGPFVRIPDRTGTWIVLRFGGGSSAVFEADKFRLRHSVSLAPITDVTKYGRRRTTGRFVGTVKPPELAPDPYLLEVMRGRG
jgi:hypothetical protein